MTAGLQPTTVRVLRWIGWLWPELGALFAYIAFLWEPLIRIFLQNHRVWTGVIVFLFVFRTHQEYPLGRMGR